MPEPRESTAVPPLPSPRRSWTRAARVTAVAVMALAVIAAARADRGSTAVPMPGGELGTRPAEVAITAALGVAPLPVTDAELAALPSATTFTTLPAAPLDPAPQQASSGVVLHPLRVVPVYVAPGGPAFAALPPAQLTSDTWLPVIAERPGWAQLLLPSRPNGATGWVVTDEQVTVATTPYRLVVDRATFRLTLLRDEHRVGSWRVGIGRAHSPTPPGRTFLLASFTESAPTFSPVIIPLGTHSTTYISYAGGPGTVGIHTWPTTDAYGAASSDGCVRVPPDALQIISTEVPLGTPVLIL